MTEQAERHHVSMLHEWHKTNENQHWNTHSSIENAMRLVMTILGDGKPRNEYQLQNEQEMKEQFRVHNSNSTQGFDEDTMHKALNNLLKSKSMIRDTDGKFQLL